MTNENPYRRHIEAIHKGPEGGRDIEQYEKELDRDFTDFQGKRILEIGAGSELKFANGLRAKGIQAEVVSLSPAFADAKDRERVLAHSRGDVLVAALGEKLPFSDKSFDGAISLHVAEHMTYGEFVGHIREAARVLRIGATIDITPVYEYRMYPNHVINDLQEQLGDSVEVIWRRPKSPYNWKRLPDGMGYKQEVPVYILTIRKQK